mgnify:CR=1 FL=1
MLIASLSVHEAAHAWAAFRLGDRTAERLGRLFGLPITVETAGGYYYARPSGADGNPGPVAARLPSGEVAVD